MAQAKTKLMVVTLGEGEAMTVPLANGEFKKAVKGDIVEVAGDYENAYLEPYKGRGKAQSEKQEGDK